MYKTMQKVIMKIKKMFLLIVGFFIAAQGIAYGEPWNLIGPGDADMVASLSVMTDGTVFLGSDVGGIYKSNDLGVNWIAVNNGIKNYDISTPVVEDPFNPQVLYVGTRGGFYKSFNKGEFWEGKRNGLKVPNKYAITAPVGAIAVSQSVEGLVYMGFGVRHDVENIKSIIQPALDGVLYRSFDRGESWSSLSQIGAGYAIRGISLSRIYNDRIYAATSGGVFISQDGGYTWTKSLDGNTKDIVSTSMGIKDNLFVTLGENGVIRSRDEGITWEYMNEGLTVGTGNNYSSIVVGSSGNGVCFYLLNSIWVGHGGLYKRGIQDIRWVKSSNNLPNSWLSTSLRMNAFAVNPLNSKQLFLGSSRYIYKSNDGGTTWLQSMSNMVSANKWRHNGLNIFGQTRVVATDPISSDIVYIGTADHGLVKSKDGGISFYPAIQGMTYKDHIYDIAISKSYSPRVYAINLNVNNQCGVAKSDNYGETWSQTNITGNGILYTLLSHPRYHMYLYAAGKDGKVFRTYDGGVTWNEYSLPVNTTIRTLAIQLGKQTTFYAGTDDGLYKSIDGVVSWTKVGYNFGKVTSILVDNKDSNIIFVGTMLTATTPGGVYKTIDGGGTWKLVLKDIRWVSSIKQIPAYPNIIYVSTNADNYYDENTGEGIFRSDDSGTTWSGVNEGLPVMKSYGLSISEIFPYRIFTAANGSGAFVTVDPYLK